MATYEDALKRFRRETGGPLPGITHDDSSGFEDHAGPSAARPVLAKCPAPTLAAQEWQAPISGLLDRILARGGDTKAPSVVIAGVASVEKATEIRRGLEIEAGRRHLTVLAAELVGSGGQSRLVEREDSYESPKVVPTLQEFSLSDVELQNSRRTLDGLSRWADHALGSHDLVLVGAPPLTETIDGAILARLFSGLIIVVERQTTTRDDLEEAVSRAKTTGCEILGLVMCHHRDLLPRLLRRTLSRL